MKAPHLISPEELLENLKDYVILEVAYNPSSYMEWHLPRAILLNWWSLRHPVVRDFADRETLERSMGKVGVSSQDRLVLYSDLGNRYAFYALWLLSSYGHKEVYVLDGGKVSWEAREFPKVSEPFRLPETRYHADPPDWSDRITVWEVLTRLRTGDLPQLIDARYKEEFEGKLSTPPEHPNEEAQTRGHIPGAINVPWNSFFDPFTEELLPPERVIPQLEERGIKNQETVVYCRTGARASLVWYYLKYVLDFKRVRLYDGSWSEWGNMVGMPVEL